MYSSANEGRRLGLNADQWAWSAFDAGSWGYASVTLATLVPLVFKQSMDGDPSDKHLDVSAVWANAVAAGTLIAGILCPFLGAAADIWNARKAAVFLTSVGLVGSITLFALMDERVWVILMFVAVAGQMFYSIMQAMYNSLIVHVGEVQEDELAFLSAIQCAIGNGGALLLMWFLGVEDAKNSGQHLEQSFLLKCCLVAGLWFFALSMPLFFGYKEHPTTASMTSTDMSSVMNSSVSAFKQTLKNREMVKYMIGTLLYADTSSTLSSVYMVFGSSIGISNHVLLHCAVLNRWMSIFMGFGSFSCSRFPFSSFFVVWALDLSLTNLRLGWANGIADRWYGVCKVTSARTCYLTAITLTLVSCILCAMLHSDFDFYILNAVHTLAGSGGYIFSRVLMARLTTKQHTSQHFGFMAAVSRVSGMIGPVVYGAIVLAAGPRPGLVGLGVMGTLGLATTANVNFEMGHQCAESIDIDGVAEDD